VLLSPKSKSGPSENRGFAKQERKRSASVRPIFWTPIAGRRNRKREPFGDQAPSSATLATGVGGESLFHVLQQFKAASCND